MFIRHVIRHVEAIKRALNQTLGEFNAGFLQGIPAFPVSLSLEGVSQMAYILPERLLTLVRPAFDLACEGFEV